MPFHAEPGGDKPHYCLLAAHTRSVDITSNIFWLFVSLKRSYVSINWWSSSGSNFDKEKQVGELLVRQWGPSKNWKVVWHHLRRVHSQWDCCCVCYLWTPSGQRDATFCASVKVGWAAETNVNVTAMHYTLLHKPRSGDTASESWGRECSNLTPCSGGHRFSSASELGYTGWRPSEPMPGQELELED
jgi:hypothetical protein